MCLRSVIAIAAILATGIQPTAALSVRTPQAAGASPPLWHLASDETFNGKRLDAVDGSIFVALTSPDPDLAAVMIFDNDKAIGPYPGQTYWIDNVAALRYTLHGEAPDGASTNILSNNLTAPVDGAGTLVQKLGPVGWTACPSPAGASPSGSAQVFVNKPGLVGEKGTGQGCIPFVIRTVPV